MLGKSSMIGHSLSLLGCSFFSLRSSCHDVSTLKQLEGQVDCEGEEAHWRGPSGHRHASEAIVWLPS